MKKRYIDANGVERWLDAGHLDSPYEMCYSENSIKTIIDCQPTEYVIPMSDVDDLIQQCIANRNYYADLGSMAQVECYTEFIDMLSALTLNILDDYDDEE